MEQLCIGIIVIGVLVALLPVILAALKFAVACAVICAGAACILSLIGAMIGGSNSYSSSSTVSRRAATSYSRSTSLPRATRTPRPTRTPKPTHVPTNTATPTRLPDTSSKLAYRLSAPRNVHLDYDNGTGSGTVSWEASRWIPIAPEKTNAIAYEILVIYPDFRSGPFLAEDMSFTFPSLNAHDTGRISIEVNAVSTIIVGPYEYVRRSPTAKTHWTPTPTPTLIPNPNKSDIRAAVERYASEVEILNINISNNIANIEYKFISWLAVPNEDIAEEAAFKVICAIRRHHQKDIPHELQLLGQGFQEDEYGHRFTIPTVEIHIPSLAVNRINCNKKHFDIDWKKIASFYKL